MSLNFFIILGNSTPGLRIFKHRRNYAILVIIMYALTWIFADLWELLISTLVITWNIVMGIPKSVPPVIRNSQWLSSISYIKI